MGSSIANVEFAKQMLAILTNSSLMGGDSETVSLSTPTVSAGELNSWYLLWAGALVFFMQAGFAMLEAGVVQAKNVQNILMKNCLDACFAALIWFLFGHGLAYGEGSGQKVDLFAGNSKGSGQYLFAFHADDTDENYTDEGYNWAFFFFQFTFCAVAATIVSGAVAERCKLEAYMVYTIVITGIIYPITVHWTWSSTGAFSAFNSNTGALGPIGGGVIDFAGSGVVHMTGGVAGLVGAVVLGPRVGRFVDGEVVGMKNQNSALVALGTFVLWMGWYGFNCGSTLGISGYGRDMARVAVTTTLSPASCAVTVLLVKRVLDRSFELGSVCNGILAGLVSITAGCSVVHPYAAVIIGIVGGLVYVGASNLLLKLNIDDPLDAFAVHGACGAWGTIAVGLFTAKAYSYNLNGYCGAFSAGCDGRLLGYQLAFVMSVFAWVGVFSTVMFLFLRAIGMFRVSKEVEEEGLDSHEHTTHTSLPISRKGVEAALE